MQSQHDIILMITYSGNTPELLALLPYLPAHIPRIVLTSHTSYNTSKLTCSRSNAILLPAPIPEREQVAFGVPAPTTSTTVAIALCDALAMAVSRMMHGNSSGPLEVFKQNHPGGAIGLNMGAMGVKLLDITVPLEDIPLIPEDISRPQTPSSDSDDSDMWSSTAPVRVLDCLLLAVRSRDGWLKTVNGEVVSPRLLQLANEPTKDFRDVSLGLITPECDWVKIPGDTTVDDTRKKVMESRAGDGTNTRLEALVVAAVVEGKVVGVIEYGNLLSSIANVRKVVLGG